MMTGGVDEVLIGNLKAFATFCYQPGMGLAKIDEQLDPEAESAYGISGSGSQNQSFIDPEFSRQKRKPRERRANH